MTTARIVFGHLGNMMTRRQPTAPTNDSGIAGPGHEYSRNIRLDGPVLLQDRYLNGQTWLFLPGTTAPAELGLDPGDRGSRWSAFMSILLWFNLGAVVMVLPYMLGSGMAALSLAIASACVALFAAGAAMGHLNGRGAMRSGTRLLLIGGAAVLLVFALEHLAGASTAG